MTISLVAVAVAVGLGLSLAIVGILFRGREREMELAAVLDLPWGERDVPVQAISETPSMLGSTIGLANRVVAKLDDKGAIATKLERARIFLRPGELAVLVLSAGIVAGGALALFTGQIVFVLIGVAASPLVAKVVIGHRIDKRKKAFAAQLPDALSLVAASLSGGHTFLRAIQMMCEEAAAPLSEEFGRVVAETRLGDPLMESLHRLALRLELPDLQWVVQAINIQQTTGGKLADLLHTLTDFIRARDEVAREIRVLTAENRMSAWVLSLLPVFLLVALQVINPTYIRPMYHGLGLVALLATAVLMSIGAFILFRMSKIEV